MHQANFFARQDTTPIATQIVMRALGDFQARGKVLAGRELPLDRLRGALRRAAVAFNADMMTDDQVAVTLTDLGAIVHHVPSFIAKHPYRIIVHDELAERGLQAFRDSPRSPSQVK